MSDEGDLIVKEKRESNNRESEEYLFLKSDIFESLFPYQLVNNYSHWYNQKTNRIEFRAKVMMTNCILKSVFINLI